MTVQADRAMGRPSCQVMGDPSVTAGCESTPSPEGLGAAIRHSRQSSCFLVAAHTFLSVGHQTRVRPESSCLPRMGEKPAFGSTLLPGTSLRRLRVDLSFQFIQQFLSTRHWGTRQRREPVLQGFCTMRQAEPGGHDIGVRTTLRRVPPSL